MSVDGKDITLKDRKKKFFPNNITLCKGNCEYSGVNLQTQKIMCSCNLNSNSNSNNMNNNLATQDNENFVNYLLDNINYKIFQCYKLLLDFDNLRELYAFYIIFLIFILILVLDFWYYYQDILTLKARLYKIAPPEEKWEIKTKEKKPKPKPKRKPKQKPKPKSKPKRNAEKGVKYKENGLSTFKFSLFKNKKYMKIKIKTTKRPIVGIVKSINSIKETLSKNYNNPELKNKNLIECCQYYDELISNYKTFAKYNESVFEKVFTYTQELFNLFVERIKLKGISKDNINNIIIQINEKMKNLISVIGYVEELLAVFLNIRDSHKDEFYEILVNYMELLNNEGIERKNKKKYSRYYSKLYFEKVFYSLKRFVIEKDLFVIDKSIKEKYEKQKAINEEELKKVNSFTNFIETKIREGKFLYGQTGFTMMGKKIEQFEKNMKTEDAQDILDLFQNMVDSFDKKENSIAEAYCLANIIKINYLLYQNKDYEKLETYILRFEKIMEGREDEKYNWYEDIKNIINKIQEN